METTKAAMSDAFKSWREISGRFDASPRELGKWLTSKGVHDYRGSDKVRIRAWKGVGLLSDKSDKSDTIFSKKDCSDFEDGASTSEFSENRVRNVRNVRSSLPSNDQPPDFEKEQQQG